MRKKLLTFALTLMITLVMAFPAQAAFQDMWAAVYRLTSTNIGDQTLTPITTGVTYKVLATGSNTAETLYVFGDNSYTSLTNPITATAYAATTNGQVEFRVDPTDSTYDRYVDLIVVDTAGGYTAVVKNFDKYTHKIVIDERPGIPHLNSIWYSCAATGAVDTGITLPKNMSVRAVSPEVVTVSTTASSIAFGLSSYSTAFINTAYQNTAGMMTLSYTSLGLYLRTNATSAYLATGYYLTAASNLYVSCDSTCAAAGYIHYMVNLVR